VRSRLRSWGEIAVGRRADALSREWQRWRARLLSAIDGLATPTGLRFEGNDAGAARLLGVGHALRYQVEQPGRPGAAASARPDRDHPTGVAA